jgi:hypothetical protein
MDFFALRHRIAVVRRAIRTFLLAMSLAATASLAFGQRGSISGTVADTSGAFVAHAQVKLLFDGRWPDQETQSAENGDFSFTNVAPGPYRLSFNAKGFSLRIITGELHAGETLSLPPIELVIDKLTTEVNVTQTQAEIAEAQIQTEEKQRIFGLLPNFFASYDHDAAPLDAKQKLELTAKTWLDPASFLVNGIIAGVWQAENTHKGFGQGAQGYAKRYGASFADYGTSLLLDKFVTTTIFRQDPRYFYKGTGTNRSRFFYAISRAFVCRGDNKKDQFCYSSFVNRFSVGFITNYYYPAADRDKAGAILRNATIGIGFDALGNLAQEFVIRKITRKHN